MSRNTDLMHPIQTAIVPDQPLDIDQVEAYQALSASIARHHGSGGQANYTIPNATGLVGTAVTVTAADLGAPPVFVDNLAYGLDPRVLSGKSRIHVALQVSNSKPDVCRFRILMQRNMDPIMPYSDSDLTDIITAEPLVAAADPAWYHVSFINVEQLPVSLILCSERWSDAHSADGILTFFASYTWTEEL